NTHLHPLAFRYISRLFCSSKSNPENAQLIFTTHDPTVTEEDCIGRDQIWLVEKGDDLASRLVPFSDYRTRDERPFRRGYLQGRYGAVPRLAG
ncbi:MAG: ATP-binding protein, partial [Boseongicola sp. SB0667_bin_21]|nr:ATP-binding protein [Boseongicola sp. SB0667_bin_21]